MSGERIRGGDEAELFDDMLGRWPCDWRLDDRLGLAYCSGNAGLGGMSTRVAEPRESELRMACAAISIILGRLRFVGSGGGCSVLERDPIEEMDPLLEPVERLLLFHDLRMDFRTLDFSEPGGGAELGGCCGVTDGGRWACCDAGRLRGAGGGGDGDRAGGEVRTGWIGYGDSWSNRSARIDTWGGGIAGTCKPCGGGRACFDTDFDLERPRGALGTGGGGAVFGDVRPDSGCAIEETDDRLLSLFLHSFLMLFTLISDEDLLFTPAALAISSEFAESIEKRLEVAWDEGRDSATSVGTVKDELRSGGVLTTDWVREPVSSGKACETLSSSTRRFASASEGYRPNGSGDKGMMGESMLLPAPNRLGTVSGGYSPRSS